MTLRLLLATAAAGASFAAPADAGCYGASGTLVACTKNVPVYSTCLYTGGSTCKPVVVTAPLCVYGAIGSGGYFTTVWC
ncbi:MAG TPA: hypothetical protein VF519_17825 [Mycobacteriales bacterium]|jgi:hypothetical protein